MPNCFGSDAFFLPFNVCDASAVNAIRTVICCRSMLSHTATKNLSATICLIVFPCPARLEGSSTTSSPVSSNIFNVDFSNSNARANAFIISDLQMTLSSSWSRNRKSVAADNCDLISMPTESFKARGKTLNSMPPFSSSISSISPTIASQNLPAASFGPPLNIAFMRILKTLTISSTGACRGNTTVLPASPASAMKDVSLVFGNFVGDFGGCTPASHGLPSISKSVASINCVPRLKPCSSSWTSLRIWSINCFACNPSIATTSSSSSPSLPSSSSFSFLSSSPSSSLSPLNGTKPRFNDSSCPKILRRCRACKIPNSVLSILDVKETNNKPSNGAISNASAYSGNFTSWCNQSKISIFFQFSTSKPSAPFLRWRLLVISNASTSSSNFFRFMLDAIPYISSIKLAFCPGLRCFIRNFFLDRSWIGIINSWFPSVYLNFGASRGNSKHLAIHALTILLFHNVTSISNIGKRNISTISIQLIWDVKLEA